MSCWPGGTTAFQCTRADAVRFAGMGFGMRGPAVTTYETNRAKIPPSELNKHARRLVAFTPLGSRIVASAETLAELEARLASAGHDPQAVALERIEREDHCLGGSELL